ncbi:MAG: SUMF1/EgtB/PvdO family nonheme iron enzyme [Candidatus Eisenbacteria sp.]|nr:SUMF1/EgtB/PvdO family nonheme iron enzyme [Candidatus Eisenbacteria bacterium]
MRQRLAVILGLAVALGASSSQGEWRMMIHRGETTEEYAAAEVDSITFVDVPVPPPMVFVPAGFFVMGDGSAHCGIDEREVVLTRGFYIGQREVTNQEYLDALQWAYDRGYVTASVASANDHLDGSSAQLLELADEDCEIQFDGEKSFFLREAPSGYAQAAYPQGYSPAKHPVKEVTWQGATRYCDWLSMQAGLPRAYEHGGDWSCNGGDPYAAEGYRLPTDAEWEYAAQYDDERAYPSGNVDPDCSQANYEGCIGWTAPLGSYAVAPEALGLADMAGNMWEWCDDWYVCDLGTASEIDPVGAMAGSTRVVRGGVWYHARSYMRCAFRTDREPSHTSGGHGFRIARTAAR